MKNSVCIVAVYFGRLPDYFPLWLKSAAKNESFNWLLITDADVSCYGDIPANIIVERMGFSDFKDCAAEPFDFEISLRAPYKICDFRPAFGVILSRYLSGYDWWAHCDLDVIWGDLSKFFSDSVFCDFDRIQENGHLTFYRNTDYINNMFRTHDYFLSHREVFSSDRSYCFDEWGGIHNISYAAGVRNYWNKKIFDANSNSFMLRDVCGGNFKLQILYWEDGCLYREYVVEDDNICWANPVVCRDEWAYVHLQKRPMRSIDLKLIGARGFYISPDNFSVKMKREHCRADFFELNKNRVFYRVKKRFFVLARNWVRRFKWLLGSLS
ncbi:hypothetical protein C7444_1216 [Sphaerotilus hippei]|uniref:Uncharacterized protein n=1 Tax=Sphaerotilus hippei TaxID=744406 RepID=A0A318GWD3_9BURK|nr:DUF6625 family protein [Sphaerotilus hippei]PXW93242.1 hypothetical protein C7444_1216 [Sphaerotilus hippei]